MTPIEKFLSEVEARAGAATNWTPETKLIADAPEQFYTVPGFHREKSLKQDKADCEFVANSRTDVVTLVECLREAVSALHRVEELSPLHERERRQICRETLATLEARIGRRG